MPFPHNQLGPGPGSDMLVPGRAQIMIMVVMHYVIE